MKIDNYDYSHYKRYGIKKSILDQYSDGDEFILFNEEDKDLDTIRVDLPKTPLWNKIDNFGLPAKEQFFQRVSIPAKLIDLNQRTDEKGQSLTQEEMWAILEDEPEYYANEIKWIRLQQKRTLVGYWVFINGKATYINGWNYRYLNFYELDIGHPEYRDRDRRFFLFAKFCYDDPYCYGFIYPKHRREGATYKTSCIHYSIISTGDKQRGGIQSMDDDSAEDVFLKHIVDPWRAMPFYFKPNHNGGDDPKNKLQFRASSSRGKAGIKLSSKRQLSSEIGFRTSGPKKYDGTKLYFYHHEECGKASEVDVNERWGIAKLCLSTGASKKIHGFSIHTSTVGEMEKGGGENFRKLCDASHYGKRSQNKLTSSGLYILFIPAYDGLEGYIDEYGMSVIDTPTPEQAKYIGSNFGARQHITNEEEHLKKLKDKSELMAFQRQHPVTFKGCFRSNALNPFFDIPLIEDRLDDLRLIPDAVVRGNFEWNDPSNPYHSGVKFVEDEEEGRFYLSQILKPQEANKIFWNHATESYEAVNVQYCAGADPFKANDQKAKKGSDGGGAVFLGHNIFKDPYSKPFDKWETNRFVCTYRNKPDTKEDYGDDMIMMCIYFGCPMYTETNVPFVREHFEKNGFAGMLVHKQENGNIEKLAGEATTVKTKQAIFNEFRTYIKRHCHRERHADLLYEIKEIRDLEDMTRYDLFTAAGFAMLGNLYYYPDMQKQNPSQQDNDNSNNFALFRQRTY